jgi:hypothetical protein
MIIDIINTSNIVTASNYWWPLDSKPFSLHVGFVTIKEAMAQGHRAIDEGPMRTLQT